jgi:hypothetical protein
MGANSEFGEVERILWLGDRVDMGEPLFEYYSLSERCRPPRLLPERVASAAAVVVAASSTVPVW